MFYLLSNSPIYEQMSEIEVGYSMLIVAAMIWSGFYNFWFSQNDLKIVILLQVLYDF